MPVACDRNGLPLAATPDVVVVENLIREDPVQFDPGHPHALVLPHRPPAQRR